MPATSACMPLLGKKAPQFQHVWHEFHASYDGIGAMTAGTTLKVCCLPWLVLAISSVPFLNVILTLKSKRVRNAWGRKRRIFMLGRCLEFHLLTMQDSRRCLQLHKAGTDALKFFMGMIARTSHLLHSFKQCFSSFDDRNIGILAC